MKMEEIDILDQKVQRAMNIRKWIERAKAQREKLNKSSNMIAIVSGDNKHVVFGNRSSCTYGLSSTYPEFLTPGQLDEIINSTRNKLDVYYVDYISKLERELESL